MESTITQEANRYLDNAKDILREKAGKKDGEYADIKYVKMAAGTAYSSVLLAIDAYLKQKEGLKFVKPRSIEEYRTRVAKQNKKLLALLNESYRELHILGYYYGEASIKTMTNGLNTAKQIVSFLD